MHLYGVAYNAYKSKMAAKMAAVNEKNDEIAMVSLRIQKHATWVSLKRLTLM